MINAYIKCIDFYNNNYEIFNLGSGRSYSVGNIVSAITKLLNSKILVSYMNEVRKNEILDTVADISKAERLLEWKPSVNIANGIKRCIY